MEYEKDITDYIIDNVPMDAERVYPRTTKNFYYIYTHGWKLWFSYQSLVAYECASYSVISRNAW